jgi:phosphopantothenate-cysteine ligase
MSASPTTAEQPLCLVVTAGGTREPIDDVRHVTNVATGTLPAALARAWLAQGATIHYLHGPGAALPHQIHCDLHVLPATDVELRAQLQQVSQQAESWRQRLARGTLVLHPVETAAQAAATLARLSRELQPDGVACAMAVADFAPVPVLGKIASRKDLLWPSADAADGLTLHLLPTAKAIDEVKAACPTTFLLGFKLLSRATESALCAAAAHLARRSHADLVFANDLEDVEAGWRRGLLVDAAGAVLARLDGGQGPQAAERLADLLAAELVQRVRARRP